MTNGHESTREVMKTLEAVKDKSFPNMLRLQFREGGKVPLHLDGLYNSAVDANKAIDYYNKGFDRKKIYPQAPTVKKDSDTVDTNIPSVVETVNGEEQDTSRIQ